MAADPSALEQYDCDARTNFVRIETNMHINAKPSRCCPATMKQTNLAAIVMSGLTTVQPRKSITHFDRTVKEWLAAAEFELRDSAPMLVKLPRVHFVDDIEGKPDLSL